MRRPWLFAGAIFIAMINRVRALFVSPGAKSKIDAGPVQGDEVKEIHG